MAYCTNCGQELIDDAKFCATCGMAVIGASVSEVKIKWTGEGV